MTSQTTFNSCMHDQMLESNRDDVKLEAMRCVTVMTAKGKHSIPRTLFPHIVKNVSSKNPELKKLIYLYLTNFADQEPELALLPVATLQKALKSPNPLVRSSALKVLTSMRLSILSAILMATLRNSVNDLSPYVRKTVAHSIIKIYRLDASLRDDLIEYIERLFNDKNSMVLSSAVATFEVVCPERLDLVQNHYRRFCFILADCNEWGQTLMLNLLVRYILNVCKQARDSSSGSADQDPRILLRSAKPLVHSNNSAVVMAVIKLYISIANHNEVRSTITRPLIRMLHSHREIQLMALKMIEDLTNLDQADVTPEPESEDENDEYVSRKETDAPKPTPSSISNANGGTRTSVTPAESADPNGSVGPVGHGQSVTRDGYIAFDDENGQQGDNIRASDILIEKEQTVVNEKPEKEAIKEKNGDAEDEEEEEGEEEDEEEEDEESEDSDEEEEDEEESDEEESSKDDDVGIGSPVGGGGTEMNRENGDKKEFDISYIDINATKDPNTYREVFRPYIKSFYVQHTDSTQVRLAKLRILTNLSSSVNVSLILRELQAYIAAYVEDREFVSAAIHAIGRCAIIVKEVAHTCLNGLTKLLSNNNEHIVSEAIVVLRSQIIDKKPSNGIVNNNTINKSLANANTDATSNDDEINKGGHQQANGEEKKAEHGARSINSKGARSLNDDGDDDDEGENGKMVSAVIRQVTRLLPTVTAPQARATILWTLAEFCDKNLTAAKCAPNVLRQIAKSFCQEDNLVKLQSLTLASKFLLSLDKEKKADLHQKIQLLAGYLFSLAKYDINHDVRDRGRFLKKILENEDIHRILYSN